MRRAAAATIVLIWLPLCAALADIYRSVDAQGHVQYSDTPTPGAELVNVTGLHTTPTPTDSPPADTSKTASAAKQDDPISQRLAQQAAARAVQNDTSQARAQQCKQAQANYEQSIEARRLYKSGADGEREYLTDDEADQQRVNNKLAMDAACKDNSP